MRGEVRTVALGDLADLWVDEVAQDRTVSVLCDRIDISKSYGIAARSGRRTHGGAQERRVRPGRRARTRGRRERGRSAS